MRHTPTLVLIAALAAGSAAAQQAPCDPMPAEVTEIAAARLFIEYNAADDDIGIHGLIDDDGWSELCVFDPTGAIILHVDPAAQLGDLGLGSFFFESREPPADVWDYAALTAAFPEGDYAVRAILHDGTGRQGTARFTTLVPAMPVITTPELSEDEDAPLQLPVADLTVAWQPVATSIDGRAPRISGYQVIVTNDDHEDPDGFSRPVYDVHLGPEATDLVVPASFFAPGTLYEVEVLAIEQSGNQTIGLGFFATEE